MTNKNVPEIRFDDFNDEWKQFKLGEVVEIKDSARIPNKLWVPKGVPYLRSSDLVDSGITGELFISNETYHSYKEKTGAPEKDDVLFTSGGKVGVVYHKVDDNPVYVQGGSILYAKTSKSYELSGTYLAAYFSTPMMFRYIDKASTGLTLKHFTLKPAKDAPIFISSLKEQNQIGEFFNKINQYIDLQQQELDTLRKTKQGFLQKMFPKEGKFVPELRFPEFNEDWIENRLGELMDVTSVKRIHQSDWTAKGVRFLRARDIVASFKKQKINDILYISVERYEEYSQKSGKVSIGDLLVTGVGSIGVPMLITNNEPIYFKDGNVIWFKNNGKMNGEFLYYSFEHNNIQNYIRNVAGIGTVGTYTIDSGKNTPITFPSLEEQFQIGNFFKQLDEIITLHQQELDALKQTKKAFLQKMFV